MQLNEFISHNDNEHLYCYSIHCVTIISIEVNGRSDLSNIFDNISKGTKAIDVFKVITVLFSFNNYFNFICSKAEI